MFRIYFDPSTDALFTEHMESTSWKDVTGEAAAVLYLFNRWPNLQFRGVEVTHHLEQLHRTVLFIYNKRKLADDLFERRIVAALVSLDDPTFRPTPDVWNPYAQNES